MQLVVGSWAKTKGLEIVRTLTVNYHLPTTFFLPEILPHL